MYAISIATNADGVLSADVYEKILLSEDAALKTLSAVVDIDVLVHLEGREVEVTWESDAQVTLDIEDGAWTRTYAIIKVGVQ